MAEVTPEERRANLRRTLQRLYALQLRTRAEITRAKRELRAIAGSEWRVGCMGPRPGSKSSRILALAAAHPTRCVTSQDVARMLGLDLDDAGTQLCRMHDCGWLARLRPGVYVVAEA